MTVSARAIIALNITEGFSAAEVPLGVSPSFTHKAANLSKALNANTTPAATETYVDAITGSASLDLTALTDSIGAALDLSGLKVLALLVANPVANVSDVVVADGAANPYSLNGTDPLTIPPGATVGFYFAEQLADVAAGAKAIDITAGVGEEFQIALVAG